MTQSHPLVIAVDRDFMRRLDAQIALVAKDHPGLRPTRSGIARTILTNWVIAQEAEQAAATNTNKE